jgi:catechol 2,3-dioxygenase-like lactoylglutathione lyase family enzyme
MYSWQIIKEKTGMTSQTRAHVPPYQPVIRPREWAHVVLRTTRPDHLIDWYCQVLGAHVVLRHALISFISWDDAQDRVAFITDAAPTAPGRVDHFAVTYAGPADLLATYERRAAASIEPHRAVNHGVSAAFYYRDPDGNQLELSCDNFASVDALNEWLTTGDFDENPYGVPLPAEALAAQLRAVPPGEVLRPDPGHRSWLKASRANAEGDKTP